MIENKFKLNLDAVKYSSKPSGAGVGALSKRIRNSLAEVSPIQLALALGSGQTMLAGAYNGSLDSKGFVSSQVIAIDFDNEYPRGHELEGQRYLDTETDPKYQYLDTKKVLKDDFTLGSASFLYKTYNFSTGHEKFRLVFILSEYITNVEEYKEIYSRLLEKYPSADKVVGQPNRIFFGGNQGFTEIDFNNRLQVREILPDFVPSEPATHSVSLGINTFKPETLPNYLLVKKADIAGLSDRLSSDWKGKTFADRMSATTYINSLDMSELFSLPEGCTFQSITRYDKTPSASIKKVESVNIWLYRDFSDNKNYDIVSLTQMLLPGTATETGMRKASRTQAINFLLEVMESKIELTDKLKDIQNQVEDFKAILLSGTLKEQYPQMYQIFGRWGYIETVNAILDIFKMNIWENQESGLNLSWLSVDTLAKKLGCSKRKVNTLLKMMTLTNIVEVLSDTQIPAELLELIKKNQTHYKDKAGNWQERTTKRPRRSNVYSINVENHQNIEQDFFEHLEERCDVLVNKGFSAKGLSRDWVYRALGKEEANRVYPQDTNKKSVARGSEDFLAVASRIAMAHITTDGYILINDLKEQVRAELALTIANTEFRYKQVEVELVEGYSLNKTNLNNALKDKLGITHLSPQQRPAILMA